MLTVFRPKRSKPLARILVAFTNLRPERSTYYLIFGYFHEFVTRKESTYSSIFGYFHEFVTRKELTYCPIFADLRDFLIIKESTSFLIFGCFFEFNTRKGSTSCSIFYCFHDFDSRKTLTFDFCYKFDNFKPHKSAPLARCLRIFTNFTRKKECSFGSMFGYVNGFGFETKNK